PLAFDPDFVDLRRDRDRIVAVEGDHGDAEVDLRRGLRELGERVEAGGAGMVVRPHRVIAELRAARGERPRDGGVEARGDAKSASHCFSSSATHSMCGVWGNMSTGRTRSSLYPASASWAAFGASVVGLHDTYTIRGASHSITRRTIFFERPARGGST